MGTLDTEGKQYLSDNRIFADAFNFLLYNGEEVIKADQLDEVDTTEIVAPYGNNARMPVQKYRDILKLWNAMRDEQAIYVLLGSELQGRVHYGMPVKDGLYDMIGYSKQIEESRRSYKRRERDSDKCEEGDAELIADNGILKIKLSSTEFLSGLRKGDRLIPIITAVIYLGDTAWDGPRSLFEMLDVSDDRLYSFLNDYKLNLISPADMMEDDFKKFHTDLGLAMKVIKHQREDADEVIKETNHRKIDKNTAFFLNRAVNLGLEYEEEDGGVDMCLAMEKKSKKDQVTGAIEAYRDCGTSDEDIIERIIKKFDVTKEYVLVLLASQKA
ncbi:MAG: Rpn family recombination-promoting nuclease/putative transposase [Lachnospiraceae bacterium]|nr:Rpn family recombination-promoting nuclease/putative transposase [Lachnospiraceae bacterium]